MVARRKGRGREEGGDGIVVLAQGLGGLAVALLVLAGAFIRGHNRDGPRVACWFGERNPAPGEAWEPAAREA